ncbi:hypothetical protein DTO282E5_9105 [Paecilomyces variotii]|nr:hypothetical protein DTO282E5_9105 [Paecilomyces variotii]
MFSRLLILLALTCGILVSADEATNQERCVESIFEAYSRLSFNGSHSQPWLVNSCKNALRTRSIYAAAKVYCSPSEIQAGIAHINEPCQGDLARTPYSEIEPELTDEYIRGLRVVEYQEVSKAVELDSPVLISRAYFEAAFRTNAAWSLVARMHRVYGAATYWFWGTVLLFGIVNNALYHLFYSQVEPSKWDVESSSKSLHAIRDGCNRLLGGVYHSVRTHFVIPPAFGSHHQRLFYYCTIPTRMEAVPIVVYYTMSFLFTILSYDIFEGNLYWQDPWEQMWRYVSDRTGILSYANLCLLWLFGGRNNPFIWATGWKFSTFNLFHRTIARVATIQAIVHSIGYTIQTANKHTYFIYLPMPWWYMGIVATVCMGLLLLFSSIYLRKHYYELFLIIHISFSFVCIGALFVHTAIFSGEYDIYLWPVVIVWLLDRFARIVRLAYCNIHVRLSRNFIMRTRGRVSYNKASDMVRLEVAAGNPKLEPKPGEHYYIYQPLKWRGYESHPFTLGAWTTDNNEIDTEESSLTFGSGESFLPARRKLVFWIRPFDGWTKRLRDECLRSPGCRLESTFLIEGPYGHTSPTRHYENVIFIAGGSGVAGVLPYIEEHILSTPSHSSEAITECAPISSSSSATLLNAETNLPAGNKTTRTRNVTLVWTARQRALLHEIGCRELRPALGRKGFDARFYATRDPEPPKTDASAGDETNIVMPTENTKLLQEDSNLNIVSGRPDIRSIILGIVRESGPTGLYAGKTAVLVCGPGGMADEARLAVHQALKEGYSGVEYFEEAFGW